MPKEIFILRNCVACSSLIPEGEGVSHQPVFMGECPTISHMCIALSAYLVNGSQARRNRGAGGTGELLLFKN